MLKKVLMSLLIGTFLQSNAQSLIINEVSQGPAGAQEYVELLVIGEMTCEGVPCVDLRGIVLDDNNGLFAPGTGTGIANGCVRFADNSLWDCVPIGTLITIYNDGDINPDIPGDDTSLDDGNCVITIPISSVLLDGHATLPNSTDSSFPTTGWVSGASWDYVAMSNANDSFMVIDPSDPNNPWSAVSWGNNNQNNVIYFSGSASSTVFYLAEENFGNQSSWVGADASTGQNPGFANSLSNEEWIEVMNNNCSPFTPLTNDSLVVTNMDCQTEFGSFEWFVSGGVEPYNVTSNGQSAGLVTESLMEGNFQLLLTDNNGCTLMDSLQVNRNDSVVAEMEFYLSQNSVPADLEVTSNGITNGWLLDGQEVSTTSSYSSQITESGMHEVTLVVTEGFCTDTISQVFELMENFEVTFPNMFTPNNDQENDYFTTENPVNTALKVEIFNRWGNLLFVYEGTQFSWNGKTKDGNELSEGVYFYVAQELDGNQNIHNGFVHLLK